MEDKFEIPRPLIEDIVLKMVREGLISVTEGMGIVGALMYLRYALLSGKGEEFVKFHGTIARDAVYHLTGTE